MNTLIERLEKAASDKGMSLSAVAEKIGLARSAATRWRKGGGVSPKTLKDISGVLGVSKEWLETGRETNHKEKISGFEIQAVTRIANAGFDIIFPEHHGDYDLFIRAGEGTARNYYMRLQLFNTEEEAVTAKTEIIKQNRDDIHDNYELPITVIVSNFDIESTEKLHETVLNQFIESCDEHFFIEELAANYKPLLPQSIKVEKASPHYGMTDVISWEHPEDLPQDQYTMIPRYEAEVSAGNGSTIHWHQVEKDQGQAFRNSFFTENGFKPNDLKAIYARGDSMEPRIYDGDSITIDTSKSDVVNEKLYVLRIEDEIFVKKLRKRPGGGLEIISLNPAYAPMNLNAEETQYIEVIGRVVQISSMGDL